MSTTNATEVDRFLFDGDMKELQAKFHPNPHPVGSPGYFNHERNLISMRQHMLPKLEEMAVDMHKRFYP
jgi:hypothetical protein